MTVYEIVKALHIENFSKHYVNKNQEIIDTKISLFTLPDRLVKDISVDFVNQTATIMLFA